MIDAARLTCMVLLALVLVALGLSIAGCGSSEPAGPVDSIDPTSFGDRVTEAAPRSGFGFSPGAGLRSEDDARLTGDLAAMASVGARWVRLDIDWSVIEADQGRFDWSEHDRLIDAARSADLEVLGMLAYSPPWARPPDSTDKHPPFDHGDFARFAAEAVTRYGPDGVAAWQIWNEPNSRLFWSTGPDPELYGHLLEATAAAIRTVDPDATIVSGGLAPAVDRPEDGWLSPETFLTGLLGSAALAEVDAVGIHPYSFPARPLDRDSGSWNTFLRLPALHDRLIEADVGPRQIWITEYGAPTGTHERAVSEDRQAVLITDALDAATDWPWLGPIFLYALRDDRDAPDDLERNYGLLRNDGSAKPAWIELVAWTEAG